MRFPVFVLLAVATCSGGCGTKEQTSNAVPSVHAAVQPGVIQLPENSPKLSQIRVDEAAAANVPVDVVEAPGKVEVNPNRLSHVLLPVAGRITEVLVRIGDTVRQGDPVLRIESPDVDAAQSQLLQAMATKAQAKAALTKAQADADRLRDLFEHNAVAKKEMLNAESLLAQAQASLEQAEAGLKQASRRIEIYGLKPGEFGQRLEVKAPISGKVLESTAIPGEFRNDLSASLMTLADLSSVWVSAEVPETSIRFIERGESVQVEFAAYPGEVFRGKVTQIADVVDPQTRTIKVRANLDNSNGRLRPEMFCRIRHVDSMESRPCLPIGAVIQGEGQPYVFREVGQGRFQQTPVTLGNRLGDRVAIVQGIRPGDRVVTDGAMLLKAN